MAIVVERFGQGQLMVNFSYSSVLVEETGGYSESSISQLISALKVFYEDVLNLNHRLDKIPRPKKKRSLPEVLNEEEVKRILDKVDNIKHKAILMMVYSAGLRVGEVVRLRKEDIDSNRMILRVKDAKGGKDRYCCPVMH